MGLPAAKASRAERLWVYGSAALFVALAAVYLGTPSAAVQDIAYSIATLPILLAAAILALWRARHGLDAERWAWVLIGTGGLVWFIGDAGWMWLAVVQHQAIPTPHWTDAFYLANTPLMVAGVLGLAWRRGTRHGLVQALDAMLVAGALFIASWMTFLGPLAADAPADAMGQAVTVAYPLGDLAIVAALALALSRLGPSRRRQLAPLLAGLALVAVADAAYAFDVLQTGVYAPTLFDLGWGLGAVGIGWAALRAPVRAEVEQGAASPVEQYTSTMALLLALMAAAAYIMRGRTLDQVTVLAGLVTGALLIVRQALFLDLHVRLTRNLTEASRLAGLGTWHTDRHRRLVLDDGARRMTGLVAGDAVHLALLVDRLAAEGAPALLHDVEHLAPGASLDRTVEAPALDGGHDRRALQVRVSRHQDGTLSGTLLDVTAEVRLEAQRAEVSRLAEVAKAKAAFINTAAHELNTPLTPIRLSLANLRSGKSKGDPLALLERNVRRLTDLLHDVLEGARLQSDKLRIERHNMDLAALVREAVEEHQPQAQAQGIHLDAEAADAVTVSGDPGRLHEVVMNLLSNALKFTPKGGHVHAAVKQTPDGRAVVTVQDDGAGIAAKDIPLLFQPFTQVGPAHEGTGLGLYICRGVVETHGGTLGVTSAGEGLGSRFTFDVPLAPAGAIPAA